MIDWQQTGRLTAALAADPAGAQRVVAEAVAQAPVFRNRDYDLTPSAVLLTGRQATAFADSVAAYVAVLNRLAALYRSEPRIQRFLGLSAAADRLIRAGTAERDDVAICRLDGYLELASQQVKILEHNADAPAGTLFTPRINAVLDSVHRKLAVHLPLADTMRFDTDERFTGYLVERARSVSGGADPSIAVLQPDGRANTESVELVKALSAFGVEAFLADPRTVQTGTGGVRFAGRHADLCWNKVNTALWQDLVEAEPALVDAWALALARDDFEHLNSMAARYVVENKVALALLQQPWFGALLEPADRELIGRLLPVAHRLGDDWPTGDAATSADAVAAEVPTRQLLRRQPAGFVLKMHYDIRGDGVTIGRSADRADWLAAISDGWRRHHLAQRFVAPTQLPVLHADGVIRPLSVSLDTFVFGGRPVGFGAKAASGDKVNVFRGGRKIAVRVCDEESR